MSTQINHRLGSRLGVVLAVAAVAAPAAYADGASVIQPPDSVERNAEVKAAPAIVQSPDSVDRNRDARSVQVVDKRSPDAKDAANPQPVTVQPVIERVTPADGMDWGDAAIGAGATLGLVLLASGGVLTVSRRRHAHLA